MGSGFKVRGRFNRFYRFNRFPILHERRILMYLIKTPRRFFISRRTAPLNLLNPLSPKFESRGQECVARD